MRVNKFFLPVILFTVTCFICCVNSIKKTSVNDAVKQQLSLQLDTLSQQANKLQAACNSKNVATMQREFVRTRQAYKKVEWFCEYYAPTLSKDLNGAPLPEIEIEETKSFEPIGLQVMEECLFPYEATQQADLQRAVRAFQSSLKSFKVLLHDTEFTEAHIMDACKLEVFRVIAVGITGFDAALSKTGIKEAGTSFGAVARVLALFGENKELQQQLAAAVNYTANSNFDTFNRANFIRAYANPVSRGILKWQHQLGIKPLDTELALRNNTATLFDKDAFNINHFVNNPEAMPTAKRTALGKDLFYSNRLSGGVRNCASCHKPELAFTDGLPKSAALLTGQFVKRNAPTLLYAGLQNAQFYDMRSPTLENQAIDVIANKDEMHASVEEAAERLQKDTDYFKRFKAAFPTMENTIKPRYITMAVASYIRSLAPFNSPFDKYMRGDDKQLTTEQVNGFNLFMGKAKCATCHFMPLFNGTAAPAFANTEGEVLGVPTRPVLSHAQIDPDQGRYFYNKIDQLKYAFKTPTLRNVAKTAPYMHNGAYQTLEQVIEFYNAGGGAGIGIKLDNQTLPTDPLNLTPVEQKAIIAFLKALNDDGI
jgi:cytochrome c peroxidase